MRISYEAGPTGFVLARRLHAWGIECLVVSPTHIPKASSDKIKTDRRDSIKLAKLLPSGDLRGIYIPDGTNKARRSFAFSRKNPPIPHLEVLNTSFLHRIPTVFSLQIGDKFQVQWKIYTPTGFHLPNAES